jgi:cytidine deaminase
MNTESSVFEQMFELAKNARSNAHAIYTRFQVGCCIKTVNGKLFIGANVENIGGPASVCAEVSAICNMVVSGERKISEILIVSSPEILCVPCGNCRQVMSEFCLGNTLVHVCDLEKLLKTIKFCDLMPYCFGEEFRKKFNESSNIRELNREKVES